jgi:hypothetical protein
MRGEGQREMCLAFGRVCLFAIWTVQGSEGTEEIFIQVFFVMESSENNAPFQESESFDSS